MADVMEHFLRGHAAGQAQQEHQQQLDDNKLRSQILKHEIDRMKIEDQMRARDLAVQHLQLLTGQSESDLPADTVTKTQPNVPARSLAGVMTGLPSGASSIGVGGSEPTAPETVPAPAAQASDLGSNAVTSRVIRPVTIPGVPSAGVPDANVTPRSLQQMMAQRAYEESMKPYTVPPGGRHYQGSTLISEGGPTFHSVGAGGLAATDASGATKVVVPGTPRTTVTRPVPGTINGRRVWAMPGPGGTFQIGGQDVTDRFEMLPSATETAATQREARAEYDGFVKQWDAEQATRRQPVPGALPEDYYAPRERSPYEAPPTMADWIDSGKPSVKEVHGIRADKAAGRTPTFPRRATTPAAAATPEEQPTDPLSVTWQGTTYQFPTKEKADAYRAKKGLQ